VGVQDVIREGRQVAGRPLIVQVELEHVRVGQSSFFHPVVGLGAVDMEKNLVLGERH